MQAGLIPRLREAHYDVWKPIRVNLDPRGLDGVPAGTNRYLLSAMVSLEEELQPERRRSPAQLAGMDFLRYLNSRSRRKGRAAQPAVLLFDQFEEILTTAPRAVEEKKAFFREFGAALNAEHFWALFIIREDYLAAFAPYREYIPTHMSTTFRLDLLDLEGAKEVAEQLARKGGRSFPAVDKLIRDLSRVQVARLRRPPLSSRVHFLSWTSRPAFRCRRRTNPSCSRPKSRMCLRSNPDRKRSGRTGRQRRSSRGRPPKGQGTRI